MYGARGFESRKGSTRTNNPTPASCRNAASGEWPNRDRVVGCSTADGLHDRGAGRKIGVLTTISVMLVTALNSTPVIFYPTDTSRDSNLVPVLFRVAILHASKYLLNR